MPPGRDGAPGGPGGAGASPPSRRELGPLSTIIKAVTSPALGLGPTERQVLLALWSHAGLSGHKRLVDSKCYPARPTLAREAGVSTRRVWDAINRLVERGLVSRQEVNHKVREYTLYSVPMVAIARAWYRRPPQPQVDFVQGVHESVPTPVRGVPESPGATPGPDACTSRRPFVQDAHANHAPPANEVVLEVDQEVQPPPSSASPPIPPPEGESTAVRRDANDNLVDEDGFPLEDLDPTTPYLISPEFLRRQMNGETPGEGRPATPKLVEEADPDVCAACRHPRTVHGDTARRGCMALGCSCLSLEFHSPGAADPAAGDVLECPSLRKGHGQP